MKRTIVYSLVLCLMSVSSCKKQEEATPQIYDVRATQASSLLLDNDRSFPFMASPLKTSELSFRVGGPLKNFDVYEGNFYRAGEEIAAIDERDFLLNLQQAEVLYKQAELDFQRAEALLEIGSISNSKYDATLTAFQQAKINCENARNAYMDTRLVAPFNGYVGQVYIDQYQDVKPSQSIISFIDISQLKIEVYVPQDVALHIKKGQPIQVLFDGDTVCHTAKVADISKNTTPNNISYLLTALLPNPGGKFLAGMSGKVILSNDAPQQQVIIPQSALMERPETGTFVWVVDKKSAYPEYRTVETGTFYSDGTVQITKGLQPQEWIANSGLRFLSEQTPIHIIEPCNE